MNRQSFDKKQFLSLFTSRAFRVGLYSTFASIVVIAIAIGVILITDKLPATYTKLDITKNQLYTISEQTEKIVGSLKQDVDIYLLAQSGNEDQTIMKMLGRYEALSGKIHVMKKDPVINPNFAKQYTSDKIYENSIIVVSGERSKFVSYNDIYLSTINYATYQTVTEYNGESSLTSAIDYVTNENLPKVYMLAGHGEKALSEAALKDISEENIETANFSFLTADALPEDADCLFINGPTSDITAEEKEKLLTYLESGGKLMLVTDYTPADMPNLDALMAFYGVQTAEGIVVEGDQNYCVSKYNHYLLPKINSHAITAPLIEGKYYVMMPISEGLVILDDKRSTVTVTELLSTSDKAFAKTAGLNATTMEKEDGDTDGPFGLGAAITETAEGKETKIVWFTTSYLLDDSINEMVSGGNMDLFINSLNWMCEREENITIRSKSLANETLTIPAAATSGWSIIIAGLIPLGFLAAAVAVWVRRRRK